MQHEFEKTIKGLVFMERYSIVVGKRMGSGLKMRLTFCIVRLFPVPLKIIIIMSDFYFQWYPGLVGG